MSTTAQRENQGTTTRPTREEYVAPDVNIFETKDGYVLEADMPGVGKDGLEITLDGNEITLTGRRAAETITGQPVFRERRLANHRRVFELDPAVDTAKITARLEQGVLTLALPKSDRVKPRKIAVSD